MVDRIEVRKPTRSLRGDNKGRGRCPGFSKYISSPKPKWQPNSGMARSRASGARRSLGGTISDRRSKRTANSAELHRTTPNSGPSRHIRDFRDTEIPGRTPSGQSTDRPGGMKQRRLDISGLSGAFSSGAIRDQLFYARDSASEPKTINIRTLRRPRPAQGSLATVLSCPIQCYRKMAGHRRFTTESIPDVHELPNMRILQPALPARVGTSPARGPR